MTTPDKSTRPLWARLAYTAGLGGATECSVLSLAASHVVSQTVALCLFTAVLGCFVLAAAHTINTVLPDDLTPSDKSLVQRYRESANRHVVLALCIATFYPAGYMLSRHYLHASEIEGFLLGNLPGLVAGAIFRKISPIAAGTQGETRRAQLLMLDRTRRAQAFSYAAFACCAIFAITMMAPDISRALHGQTVHLGEFNAFGITALASLYMLAAPWTWFETPSVARIMEDESLARFRLLAYRNAFFVMALGLVLVADLVRNPPRLALLMVPVVFNAALFTAFATLVILELRAGTFKPSAETFDEPAENSAVGT
jgi:hypothetical protein